MDIKKRLIIVGVSFLVVVLVVLFIILNGGTENVSKQNNVTHDIYKYDSAVRVLNNKVYYNIINVINGFDNALGINDNNYLLDVLANEYLNEKALNSNNIIDVMNHNNYDYETYVTDLYYTCNINNCHYFATLDGNMFDEDGYVDQKNERRFFMISVDKKNKTYYIKPIEGISDFNQYIANYNFKDVVINKNNNNSFISDSYDESNILKYYLHYVQYLCIHDENNAPKYINNYNSSQKIWYLNKLNNVLYSYRTNKNENNTIYSGMLYDGSLISIEEESPMNFKISFN